MTLILFKDIGNGDEVSVYQYLCFLRRTMRLNHSNAALNTTASLTADVVVAPSPEGPLLLAVAVTWTASVEKEGIAVWGRREVGRCNDAPSLTPSASSVITTDPASISISPSGAAARSGTAAAEVAIVVG